MLLKKLFILSFAVCFCFVTIFTASPAPPRNKLIASQVIKNMIDNGWTNLEFAKDIQPAGLYYVELTEPVVTPGCWGSKKDFYPNGENGEVLTAWKDDDPWEAGKADFKLQYRLGKAGAWAELIAIPAQGVAGDAWWPFGLNEAKTSIGQTFLALEEFDGVGLSTPTWSTGNSGCTMTLYSSVGPKQPVESKNKLAVRWAMLKISY
jgi:hypothetical protein